MGYMTDIQFLEDIKQEDFANSSTKFNKMSYVSLEEEPDNYGLTPFGFK
jgi:hypothetical protein